MKRKTRRRKPDDGIEAHFFNRDQAARYLGVQTPVIRSWEKTGKLTPIKVGRKVQFSRQEIDDLMASASLPAERFVFRDRKGQFRSAKMEHEKVAEIVARLTALESDETAWTLALAFWTREWTT